MDRQPPSLELMEIRNSLREINAKIDSLSRDIATLRLDDRQLSVRIATMAESLGICQSRCHVPGPGLLRRIWWRIFGDRKKAKNSKNQKPIVVVDESKSSPTIESVPEVKIQ
jgi:hypothetical protein